MRTADPDGAPPQTPGDGRLDDLARILEAVGPTSVTDNLAGARWSKLAINCAISSLGTVGKTLTWAPLAVLAVVVVVYTAMHVRKRRKERDEAEAFAQANAEPQR